MPSFRWPEVRYDVALAREVISCRPSKPLDWVDLAGRLSLAFSEEGKPVELKGRGCRERLDRLLEKFKSDNSQSLKRSGTEEEYDELSQLLEDISSYQRDQVVQVHKDKQMKKKKEVEDKRKAEDMRDSAMETMSCRKRRRESGESLDSSLIMLDSDEECSEGTEVARQDKKSNMKRMSKLGAMDMMQRKFEVNSQLRAREMDLKKEELALKKRKMDQADEERERVRELERRRMNREEEDRRQAAEERDKRMEMEFAERKLMLNLLTKLANKDTQ